MLQMCLWLTDFKVLVTNSGRNRCNVSNWHWQHMLRGRSVLQRWFTEREGGSSQLSRLISSSSELAAGCKKRKGFVDGQCHSNPWLGESSCRYWFQEWCYIREPERYYVLIPVKGIVTMTKTVMVNWAVMVFICRQSEPARPRACHSLRTAFTRRHTMWHHTLDAAFV